MKTLNALALGYAGALISALIMLVMGIFGRIGFYTNAVNQMQDMHMFFSLSFGGIISGIIEAAIIGFITLWIFGLFYNLFTKG